MISSSLFFRTTFLACSLVAGSLSPQLAWAGGKHEIEVSSFDDFNAGETSGAAIEGSGKVTVGFEPIRTEIGDASTIFRCHSSAKRTWIGSAGPSTIFQIKEGSKKQAVVKKIVELKGATVSALSELPNGDILAATLPGGEIFRIRPGNGKVSTFAKLDVEQIWALKVDRGRVLVGTGPKGQLYSMSLSGKNIKMLMDVEEKDIMTILPIGREILVGTSGQARIYQADAKKKEGILLQEFSGTEVHSLALWNNQLVATVNAFKDRSVSSLQSMSKHLKRGALTGDVPSDNKVAAKSPSATAYIYAADLGKKLDLNRASDSAWERWTKKSQQYFTDMLPLSSKEGVLVSSSKGGKVYRFRGRRDQATVADLEERQATSLCRWRGRVLATTGDGSAAYSLNQKSSKKANYISKVYDAQQPANYGAVNIEGNGALKVFLRSGPGDEVDSRWTKWSALNLKKRSKEKLLAQAKLPRRRYFQFKVELGSADSEFRSFHISYAPENLAPLLTSIQVDQPSFSASDAREPKPKATIKWKVDARDNDDLIYDVQIRPEGAKENEWTPLNSDGPISKREIDLDLNTVPNGTYEVAVTASDEPENGSSLAQTDRMVSDPFTVDRVRPSITGLNLKNRRLTGKAKDQESYIHDVSVKIDSGDFRNASPDDGIFDGPNESFSFELPDSVAPGRHRIVVRARDSRGNLITEALMTKVD